MNGSREEGGRERREGKEDWRRKETDGGKGGTGWMDEERTVEGSRVVMET